MSAPEDLRATSDPAREGAEAGRRDLPVVELDRVTVTYGAVHALDELSLAVPPGAAIAVLGPSGAGKTTLLHVVAGFATPTRGTVRIGGETVVGPRRTVPPEHRRVGVVFQHYALWPHLSALDTVAYPLRRQGLAAADARRRATELLDGLGVAELAERRPAEMSGGQQQRVGVARALARDAVVYCFDEPTAHLDTALRAVLQQHVADRRRATRAAAVYATHDAGEALAIADQVVLLRDGRVVQVGTPIQVYARPVDRWAALLTGPASVLDLPVRRTAGGGVEAVVADAAVPVAADAVPAGPRAAVLVRPEWADLDGPLRGTVRHVWYRGPHTDHHLEVPGGVIDVRTPGPPRAHPGDEVGWALRQGWLLPDPAPAPAGAR
jgi:iron(III) transport system ATP-binding protein